MIAGYILISLFLSISALGQARYERDLSNLDWTIWLDREAQWENDKLYLPSVDVSKLPLNPPTRGWQVLTDSSGQKVNLPATVEQYYWGTNGNSFGVAGDYVGVSWFTARIMVPSEYNGKRVILTFESVRLRAEIYINEKIAGYDCVGNTPFEIDISRFVNYGTENTIAIRITDPDGNFDWKDSYPFFWADQKIPISHGFGGITGRVKLIATDRVYIKDVFIKNKPTINHLDVQVTLANESGEGLLGKLSFRVCKAIPDAKPVLFKSWDVNLKMAQTVINKSLHFSSVDPWSVESPHLYLLQVEWQGKDSSQDSFERRFGFRWFSVEKIGNDRQFFLNGKRIVLISAISWGFWPVNGIFPTPELAGKQIRIAKAMGLNMLNLHRAIGQTLLFDRADELGLLIYEEPGGYKCAGDDSIARILRREKLFRMLKRDRNHPSLIIYNMANEVGADPDENNKKDIVDAHKLDSSRIITFSSTNFSNDFYNGTCPKTPALCKLYMLPYNEKLLYQGWWDEHHAAGSGCYLDEHYKGPEDYLRYTNHAEEIIFYGEEGAIGTPPRLQLIQNEIAGEDVRGWDGDDYLKWYQAYDCYLHQKGFDGAFPSVDELTKSMGNVAFYYQGRIIENIRINNIVDGYVINGWEAEKLENHSGIVDCYRNPKGDIDLLSYYNQPLFVAVKARDKVIATGSESIVDIHLVNEVDLEGKFDVAVKAFDDDGILFEGTFPVKLAGGTRYGQLLVKGITIGTRHGVESRYIEIEAMLKKGEKVFARGQERLLSVTINSDGLSPVGVVLDTSGKINKFLTSIGGPELPDYNSGQPEAEYLVVGEGNIPEENLLRQNLLQWVMKGHTLIILKNADKWAEYFARKEVVAYGGKVLLGTNWKGGNFFVRQHPLFEGLPVNTAFNWEYQAFARYTAERYGLRLWGEEAVVGAVSDHKPEVTTAVGIIPLGKGRIIFSTLDILHNLALEQRPSVIAQRLLLNCIRYASVNLSRL